VLGFATAAVPTVLAAAVLVLPMTAKGAAQDVKKTHAPTRQNQESAFKLKDNYLLRHATLKTPAAQEPLSIASNTLLGVF
jgi:hypothetical protein